MCGGLREWSTFPKSDPGSKQWQERPGARHAFSTFQGHISSLHRSLSRFFMVVSLRLLTKMPLESDHIGPNHVLFHLK